MIVRILEADGREPIAVKKGFCWPAAAFGAFWALFKRFWSGAAVLLGVMVVVNTLGRAAERSGSMVLSFASFVLLTAALYLIGRYANLAFTAYLTSKGYRVVTEVEADSPEGALRIFAERGAVTATPPSGTDKQTTTGPSGLCPNCDAQIPLNAAECVRCKAQFGPGSVWQVKPLKPT